MKGRSVALLLLHKRKGWGEEKDDEGHDDGMTDPSYNGFFCMSIDVCKRA